LNASSGSRAGACTLLAFVAAWVALAAPFILPFVVSLPVSLAAAALVVWLISSTQTWLDRDPLRALFLLGVLVIGQLTFRPVASLPLSDMFFSASLLLVVVSIMTGRRVRTAGPPALLIAPAILVLVGGAVAAIPASSPGIVIGATARVAFVVAVLPWLALQTLERKPHVAAAAIALAVSIAASGAAAFAQLIDDDLIPGTSGSWGRLTGFTQHVNDLGSQTAVLLLPVVLGVLLLPGRALRRVAWVLPALVLGGLVLSGSLSAYAALFAGLVTFGILARSEFTGHIGMSWPRVAKVAVVIVIATVALVVMPPIAGAPSIVDRVTTTFDPQSPNEQGTVWTRWHSIKDAWTVIQNHPVMGVGANPDELVVGVQRRNVHSTPLATWAAMGFIAMLGVVAGFVCAAVVTVQAASRAPPELAGLARALAAAFVVYCVFALGNPALYRRHGWIAVALAVVIGHLGRTSDSASLPQADSGTPRDDAVERVETGVAHLHD
jgi:hypothetical protein